MASLLRQIVAGPRAPHAESKLDLCYVTDEILVTSGPAVTYPHLAYRNPLPRLLSFLDTRHGTQGWKIFEFRAEGTGYSDADVRGNVQHFPWPDHHPPPFWVLIDLLKAIKTWLDGDGDNTKRSNDTKRVAVLHCKAGKGRSGSVASSFLVTCRGWSAADALGRFTQRRMRVGWGDGVSIKSQRRWVRYVGRWTAALGVPLLVFSPNSTGTNSVTSWYNRIRQWKVAVNEVRVWGLREGSIVSIRGFYEDGRKIGVLASWAGEDGETSVWDGDHELVDGLESAHPDSDGSVSGLSSEQGRAGPTKHDNNNLISAILWGNGSLFGSPSPKTSGDSKQSSKANSGTTTPTSGSLSSLPTSLNPIPPTLTVFRPVFLPNTKSKSMTLTSTLSQPLSIVLPTLDVNVCIIRRNKNIQQMITATAHSWFNAFFEGSGPEKNGIPNSKGTYRVEWDSMDGAKGSSRRGVRAVERVEVDWEIIDLVHGSDLTVVRERSRSEEVVAVAKAEALTNEKLDHSINQDPAQTERSEDVIGEAAHPSAPANDVDSDAEEGVKTYGVEGEAV